MAKYRVVRKQHVRSPSVGDDAEVFDVGDVIDPTDAELEAFPDRFEEIFEAPPDDAEEEEDEEGE